MKTGIYIFCDRGRYNPIYKISCFNYLLDHGLNINEVDDNGNTPLHLDLSVSNTPVARFIIKRGGNVNAINSNQDTLVHLYFKNAQSLNDKFIQVLLKSDYDFNNKNNKCNNCLHLYFYSI